MKLYKQYFNVNFSNRKTNVEKEKTTKNIVGGVLASGTMCASVVSGGLIADLVENLNSKNMQNVLLSSNIKNNFQNSNTILENIFNSNKIKSFGKNINKKILLKYAFPLAALLTAMIPSFTKKCTTEEDKELTKSQKRHNNIRKLTPLLSSLILLPRMIDRAIGFKNISNCAQKFNNSNLYKEVIRSSRINLLLNIFCVVGLGLASICALKIKDNSDNRNKISFTSHQG